MKKRKLRLHRCGMFSNVNKYLSWCHHGTVKEFVVVPIWKRSLYSNEQADAWDQYFQRIDHTRADIEEKGRPLRRTPKKSNAVVRPRGKLVPNARRKKDAWRILLPPADRYALASLVANYLILNDRMRHLTEGASNNLGACEIGLHLRGPGRLHGGTEWMSSQLGGNPPWNHYFDAVDRQIDIQGSDSRILLATDATLVRERVRARYGDRVCWYDASLTEKGEVHHAKNAGGYPRVKLGDDVIVEAYLLSRVRFLVHGNSNVTNFILGLNPRLAHHDIYERFYNDTSVDPQKTAIP